MSSESIAAICNGIMKNERFVSIVNELLSGFPVIKSFRAETQASRLFSQRNEQAEEAKKNKRRTEQLISLLANDAGIIAQMGIFLAGAWLAISGKGVTAGVVIVFVQLMNYILNQLVRCRFYGQTERLRLH